VSGQGTVLLLHGAGGGAWQWRDWLPVLRAAGWRARAHDLRPARDGLAATTLDDYQHQVAGWLADCPPHTALVGASLGALLALRAAAAAPGRVLAAVLVNPVPPGGLPDRRCREGWPDVVPWSRELPLARTRASLPEADRDTVRWVHGQWRDESGQVMRALCAGYRDAPPPVPLLVLCSGADRTVPLAHCRATAAWARCETLELAEASHLGPLLGPQAPAVARQVTDWLDARLRTGP